MSFTQQHADENKAMAARAYELVRESGFFNPPPPLKDQFEYARYRKPYYDTITAQMAEEFPDIPRRRVSSRVSTALMVAHGRWKRHEREKKDRGRNA